MTDHVLVPFDLSPHAEKALEHALGLPEVSLTLLTVIDPFDVDPERFGLQSPTGVPGLPGYSPEWYEEVRAAARERLDEACERATAADVPCSVAIRMGSPARRIVSYVTENDVDSVVMGSHGRTGVSRVLLGSVAERVVRRSPVPVTVVR
jgi:nucleotide-binding universal stress UspA family protein